MIGKESAVRELEIVQDMVAIDCTVAIICVVANMLMCLTASIPAWPSISLIIIAQFKPVSQCFIEADINIPWVIFLDGLNDVLLYA